MRMVSATKYKEMLKGLKYYELIMLWAKFEHRIFKERKQGISATKNPLKYVIKRSNWVRTEIMSREREKFSETQAVKDNTLVIDELEKQIKTNRKSRRLK